MTFDSSDDQYLSGKDSSMININSNLNLPKLDTIIDRNDLNLQRDNSCNFTPAPDVNVYMT